SAASLRLSFQPCKVGVKLIFRNAFTAFQLLNSSMNLLFNGLPVRHEPFVPLAQHFEGAINHLVRAAVSAGA
ncbi:MAG TPA: hypothetical protein VG168_09675, partial [Bryobacteraceae bacterium]|nr:hypothetical protein [Bryobacteraceae bacterium]